ncbi:MAG: lysophospholipid acyltransferase family protein [Lysobacterales bacterium]|jgi:1-acyl-sn-glycerol-3-phosphate acyltransferase
MISILASIVRFIVRSLSLIVYLLFLLAPIMMLVNHYRRLATEEGSLKADRLAIGLANRLTRFFGVRVEVTGEPQTGPVLFAANHISWLDITVLHSACAMGFVSKAEIESWPVFSSIARVGGTIFHQRGNHDSAADVSSAMEQRLQEGRAVAIFPEGGIKPGSPIRVFHARMFRPAVEAGCPVQPVMVRYMRDGRIDADVAFRVGESMLINVCRQLARPKAVAQVHFLPVISALNQPRRVLADGARASVVSCYEDL